MCCLCFSKKKPTTSGFIALHLLNLCDAVQRRVWLAGDNKCYCCGALFETTKPFCLCCPIDENEQTTDASTERRLDAFSKWASQLCPVVVMCMDVVVPKARRLKSDRHKCRSCNNFIDALARLLIVDSCDNTTHMFVVLVHWTDKRNGATAIRIDANNQHTNIAHLHGMAFNVMMASVSFVIENHLISIQIIGMLTICADDRNWTEALTCILILRGLLTIVCLHWAHKGSYGATRGRGRDSTKYWLNTFNVPWVGC